MNFNSVSRTHLIIGISILCGIIFAILLFKYTNTNSNKDANVSTTTLSHLDSKILSFEQKTLKAERFKDSIKQSLQQRTKDLEPLMLEAIQLIKKLISEFNINIQHKFPDRKIATEQELKDVIDFTAKQQTFKQLNKQFSTVNATNLELIEDLQTLHNSNFEIVENIKEFKKQNNLNDKQQQQIIAILSHIDSNVKFIDSAILELSSNKSQASGFNVIKAIGNVSAITTKFLFHIVPKIEWKLLDNIEDLYKNKTIINDDFNKNIKNIEKIEHQLEILEKENNKLITFLFQELLQ